MNIKNAQRRQIINLQKGFTLIELLIVIAIMSMTMAIGLPSFQSIIASSRLTSAANSMVSALQLARMEALKQHKPVVIEKKTNWKDGWNVFVDLNNNSTQDVTAEPTIATFDKLNSTLTVTPTSSYNSNVFYDESGRSNTGGTFKFCTPAGENQDFRSVVIAPTGRVHVETRDNSTATYATVCQ